MNFKSNADEIRFYIKELLEDEREHTISDINKYISKHSSRDFSSGMLSGALKTLLDDKNYENIKRGVYQKVSKLQNDDIETKNIELGNNDIKTTYLTNINKILEEAIIKTNNVSSGDMLKFTDDELNFIRKIGKQVIDSITAIKNNINNEK